MSATFRGAGSGVALAPNAVQLRNTCVSALARRAGQRVPEDVDLASLPNDVGVHDAWSWWRLVCMAQEVNAVRAPQAAIAVPRRRWPRMLFMLCATLALLFGWPPALVG